MESTSSSKRGGATRSVGLGLYIVGEIVKAHGGSVAAESDAVAGTTFVARFPAAAGLAQATFP